MEGASRVGPGRWLRASTVVAVALSAVGASRAEAQPRGPEKNWSFYWENDSRPLVWTEAASSDELYTNGLRLVVAQQAPPWDFLTDPLLTAWGVTIRTRTALVGHSLSFGSNLFTPRRIETVEPEQLDRPYSALLYAGASINAVTEPLYEQGGRLRTLQSQAGHDLELIFGATGQPGFGEAIQGGIHVLKASRFPKAWSRELRSRPAINLDYTYRELVGLWDVVGRFGADATAHGGFRLGNVQTLLRGGGTVRVGYNLTGLPTVQIPYAVARTRSGGRPALEASVSLGWDFRRVGYSYYLDAARADPPHFIQRAPSVTDRSLGVSLRWKSWRLSATQLKRDPEFTSALFVDGGDALEYGSAVLSREFDGTGDDGALGLLAILAPEYLTVGFGTGNSEVESAARSEGTSIRAQVAWSPAVLRGVRAGFEISGVVREDPGPLAQPSTYTDDFLRTVLVVAERRLGFYDLEGRAGVGLALAKRQFVVDHEEDVVSPISEKGLGLMAGLAWDFEVAPWASIVLDASWHHSAVAVDAGDASFVRWGAGIRLNRDP